MPNFSYSAVNQLGKTVKGSVEASDLAQATSMVTANELVIVDIKQIGALDKNLNITLFETKPKPRDLAIFCRQFVSISSAGVPIIAAFDMLSEQTENKLLREAIANTASKIRQGMGLSESMAERPKVFPDLLITMVAAGESSGSLETSFDRMALQFEKDAKLKALIKRSSAYPLAVLAVAVIVVLLLLGYVVPQFETILSDLGAEMPAFSAAVISIGKVVQSQWVWIVLIMGAVVFGLVRFGKTPTGKDVYSRIQLKTPLFGILAVKTASARTCRTLATLIAAGIPMIESIHIVSDVMSNVKFKNALLDAADDVTMGIPLSEPLTTSNLFPPLVCHMTKIGEESGDFEGMLTKLADYYDEEVENTTATVMSAIEPLLIIVLAVVVIAIIFACLMPMMSIYDGLSNI